MTRDDASCPRGRGEGGSVSNQFPNTSRSSMGDYPRSGCIDALTPLAELEAERDALRTRNASLEATVKQFTIDLALNGTMLAHQTDLAREAENRRDALARRLAEVEKAGDKLSLALKELMIAPPIQRNYKGGQLYGDAESALSAFRAAVPGQAKCGTCRGTGGKMGSIPHPVFSGSKTRGWIPCPDCGTATNNDRTKETT